MARNLFVLVSVCFWIVVAGFANAKSYRVAVISDLNGSYGSTEYGPGITRAIDAIIALEPDLVLATGDMVAGQRRPHLNATEIRAMWDGFHKAVTDPLSKAGIPLAVTPGNHDASAYGGFEREREIFAEEWRARRPAVQFVDAQNYPFHYAFDLGGVRFASLDITTLGTLDFGQDQWLARVMSDGPKTRIVFSHIPFWPFAQGRETEIVSDPLAKSLLSQTGIYMHLSGHHHAYFPGASNGIAYVSQSCIGASPRRLIGEADRSPRGFTIIDISPEGSLHVSHFAGSNYTRETDADSLPARLTTSQGVLTRIDLADLPKVDLSPAK
ncbi:MAG: metallophosphoesterase family protein [Marinosulfonomonas sp.]